MRRRHEEELAAAEERRQRDIAEQEGRRVAELEAAENRRRTELQARDEEHHGRVTEIERRHLTEKTDVAEKAPLRVRPGARSGGACRRGAGGPWCRSSSRPTGGCRVSRRTSTPPGPSWGPATSGWRSSAIASPSWRSKVADYEDQIVRAFQRIRSDDKTAEKTRRALSVALALLDERATAPAAPAPRPVAEEAGGVSPLPPASTWRIINPFG